MVQTEMETRLVLWLSLMSSWFSLFLLADGGGDNVQGERAEALDSECCL